MRDRIVLHLSGPDRPGVTSTLSKIVARQSAKLIDIGQNVLHGFLILSAVIELPHGSDCLKEILFEASKMGLRVEVAPLASEKSQTKHAGPAFCITMMGNLETGIALSKTTDYLASRQINISEINKLSHDSLEVIELLVDLPANAQTSPQALRTFRGEILGLGAELKVDLAIQKNDIFRRHKRIVCMDVDSTFVQMEVIDELAGLANCKEKVAKITERAMQGELDFKAALRERVACLKGLKIETAEKLLKDIPITPGADKLVSVMRSLGIKVGLVSGGFDFFVNHLREHFQLDFAFSNQLVVKDGVLTGEVNGTIVDAERKAQVLADMTQLFHCRQEQTVAVGDGANDMLMLQQAGLGIAFQAKPKLQQVADLSLNRGGLDRILSLMGCSDLELGDLLAGKS